MPYFLIEATALDRILDLAEDDGAEKQRVADLQAALATAQTQEGEPLPADTQARIDALGSATPPPAGTATLHSTSGLESDNVAGGEGTGDAPPTSPGSGDRSAQPGAPATKADAPPAESSNTGGPTSAPKPPGDGQPANGM